MSAALQSLMRDLPPSGDRAPLLGGLLAFIAIGAAGAAAFVVLSTSMIWLDTGFADWTVNTACYASLIVPVYLLHRRFSFDSDAPHSQALPRYMAVQCMALLLAAVFSYVVHGVLAMPTVFASTLVIALTSGVNFMVLRSWAFARAHGAQQFRRDAGVSIAIQSGILRAVLICGVCGMKSALIVYGGWSGHDPEECAAIYRRWLHEDGFSVRTATETSAFADPSIRDLSLIIPIFTMSKIEKDEVENLTKAVEGGVGLAGHHGGMSDAFRDAVDYQFMVGGQWVAHPGNIIDYTVDVADPLDPVMAGIKSFRYTSEQYYMHVDPSNHVLATTTFSGEHAPWIAGVKMPVAWKRQHGKGRVFHSTLGHQAKEFDVLEMATMMRRGMNWAAREE